MNAGSARTDLGGRLASLRADRGLSQQALSDTSGVSRATIANIEGGRSAPYMRTRKKLAKALGVGVEDLGESGGRIPNRLVATSKGQLAGLVGAVRAQARRIAYREGKTEEEVVAEAERLYRQRHEAEVVLGGPRSVGTALAEARQRGRKPRGTPKDRRPRLEPGRGLSDAVVEERRAGGR